VTRHAYASATAGSPAMTEKAAKHLDSQRFGIPDNSFRRDSRMRRLHRFAARVQKARKFRALFGVMIDYKPQCQQGGNHEHDNVGFTRCVGRRAEADHPTARFVLFA
jgi:hypothetical protein